MSASSSPTSTAANERVDRNVLNEYNASAEQYDAQWGDSYTAASLSRTLPALERAIARALTHRARVTVLDVGCGTGELLLRVLRAHARVDAVGVDPADAMLDQFRRKLESDANQPLASRVRLHAGPVATFELGAGESVDVIVTTNCFHFFPEPLGDLRAMAALLRGSPAPALILTDWCDDFVVCWLCKYWLRFRGHSFKDFYSAAAITTLLNRAGFVLTRAVDAYKISAIWGLMTVEASLA